MKNQPNTKSIQWNNGFTLMEIMLVVIIIGTLAAMVLPNIVGKGTEARIKITRGSMAGIATALQDYESQNGFFPTTAQGLEALMTKPGSPPIPAEWKRPYLTVPPLDAWGRPFQYRCPPTKRTYDYDLFSLGPDGKESDDDITNWAHQK
ncbi:MAG: type II secretion system major pseudopilin GspG [Planctomycetota bacterium]